MAGWIQWCTGHYRIDWARTKAAELRASGKYEAVQLRDRLQEGGQEYCRIYVKRR